MAIGCHGFRLARRSQVAEVVGGQDVLPSELDPEIGLTFGYVALFAGIVFSLLVGCGLMALVFYSNRKGYDELPHIVRRVTRKRRAR